MPAPSLFAAVQRLAAQTHTFSDGDLAQPYRWRAHEEGVRFALIGTYHELRALAVQVGQLRTQSGQPQSVAQRALAPYHDAYRELQALLLGVDGEMWDRRPDPNEWPLRVVVTHMLNAERTFFALVYHGVEERRAGKEQPTPLPAHLREALFDDEESFYDLYESGTVTSVMQSYDKLHRRVLGIVSEIDDATAHMPTLWWEGEPLSILYRLHRFDAHLRQHTVQAEKLLVQLGQQPTEARRLLRLVYRALAEVESLLLGAADVAEEERRALADRIEARSEEVVDIVIEVGRLMEAVAGGEGERAAAILNDRPGLADAVNEQGVPLVRDALYRRRPEIAATFVEAGASLTIMDGAALGRLDVVEAAVAEWPGWVKEYSVDGFTPLQLACFFGHEQVARYLLEQGAAVDAVARNSQKLRALHAAVAGPGGPPLVGLLLEHGADPDARQQQSFTALHSAGQQGDLESTRLLLEHGADPKPTDDAGRTPADLARAQGHAELVSLLEKAHASRPPSSRQSG